MTIDFEVSESPKGSGHQRIHWIHFLAGCHKIQLAICPCECISCFHRAAFLCDFHVLSRIFFSSAVGASAVINWKDLLCLLPIGRRHKAVMRV